MPPTMRVIPLGLAGLVVALGVVSAAPAASADQCEPGDEACQVVETANGVKDWLVYCVKQKFIGDSWTCLPNPYP